MSYRPRTPRALGRWVAMLVTLAFLTAPGAIPAAAFQLIHCPPGSVRAGCPAPNDPVAPSPHRSPPLWYGDHFHSLGFLIGSLTLMAAGELVRRQQGRSGIRPGAGRLVRPLLPPLVGPLGGSARRWLLAAGTLGGVALLLALATFSRPALHDTVASLPYTQRGTFGYSAPAPSGVYDGDHVSSGQPIFPRLSPKVDFTFSYQFESSSSAQLSGTDWLTAEVSDGNGWLRTIELRPQANFQGSSASLIGTLDLTQVQTIIQQFESQTGTHQASYTVSVVPQFRISGTLDDEYLEDSFTPRFDFVFDQSSLRPAYHPTGVDPLAPSAPGSISVVRRTSKLVTLGNLSVRLGALRSLAVLGLLLALGLAGLVGQATRRAQRGSEVECFHIRFGGRMVPVRDVRLDRAEPVVDLRELHDLGRLAEQFDLPILVANGSPRYYYVRHGGLLYRCRLLVTDECDGGDLALVQ